MCWDPRTYALCVRQMAIGEQIDRLVGLGVEFGKLARSGELRAREDALRQFEMIADIEELDRVDAAEDQQMVVCRQMMESLDGRPEPLVLVQEPENADQHCVGWQRGEHRQGLARGTRANGIGLGIAEEGQRVVEDVADAVEVSGVEQIAVGMNDRADLLRLLDPAEIAG